MKKKLPFILSLIFYLLYRLTSHLTNEPIVSLLIFIFPISILITSLVLRKKIKYKSWFLSKKNILLDREKSVSISEIPIELLYQKLLDVLDKSKFNLIDSDANNFQILAATSLNFWTWGENIYIEVNKKDNIISEVIFTSVTVYGSSSWNRNEKNHEYFCQQFEQSLII